MSYHIEGNGRFNNLPERILVREDGYMAAYKFDGEPIVDYWYVPKAENAKLRDFVQDMIPFIEAGIDNTCVVRRCYLFEECDDTSNTKCLIEEHIHERLRDLGIEVDK